MRYVLIATPKGGRKANSSTVTDTKGGKALTFEDKAAAVEAAKRLTSTAFAVTPVPNRTA